MSGEDYSEYDALLADVKSMIEKSEGEKQQKIQELAKKLDWLGHKQKDIAQKIVADLKGYATKQYVYQCLEDRYKHEYERYQDPEKSTSLHSNEEEQNERETDKKPILVQQSSTGNSQSNKPVTDKPNNDGFGMGVVPMTNQEQPGSGDTAQNIRMIMSGPTFGTLIKTMIKFYKENGNEKDYTIEFNSEERAFYVDLSERGEARNVD